MAAGNMHVTFGEVESWLVYTYTRQFTALKLSIFINDHFHLGVGRVAMQTNS